MSVSEQLERRQIYYTEQAQEVCDRILSHRVISRRKAMEGRLGCFVYKTPIHAHLHFQDVHAPLGKPARNKIEKYKAFSREKAVRLHHNPGMLLSYLCRDEAAEQYGGSVRGNGFLHSISGWPQDLDEVHALAAAVKTGDMTLDQALARLELRCRITELKLTSGLVVPVKPNSYARFLPELAR